jgi:demethylspheroidene O-methyltransferase
LPRRAGSRPGRAGFPFTRGIAKREGEALFDLVAGFVHSQVLHALVELRVLHMLLDAPATARAVAGRTNLDPRRAEVLLRAGVALGLMKLRRDGRFALSRRGAALLGVPGLEAMILHHRAFYRDLEDPVASCGTGRTRSLPASGPMSSARRAEIEPEVARTYSDLMADSQALVAEETLRTVDSAGSRGSWTWAAGRGRSSPPWPRPIRSSRRRSSTCPRSCPPPRSGSAARGFGAASTCHGGSFRDEPLPGARTRSRSCACSTTMRTRRWRFSSRRVREALPPGGRMIVSEPMTGGARPSRPGDTYFALYTMAMGTGRTRSPAEIAGLLTRPRVLPTSPSGPRDGPS